MFTFFFLNFSYIIYSRLPFLSFRDCKIEILDFDLDLLEREIEVLKGDGG